MSKLTKTFWLPSIPPCRCRQEREEEKTTYNSEGIEEKASSLLSSILSWLCFTFSNHASPSFSPLTPPFLLLFISTNVPIQLLLRNHTLRTLKRQVNFLAPPTSLLSVLFLFKTCILCIEWGMGEQTKFKMFWIVFEERLLCAQYLPLSQPGLCRIVVCHMQPMYAGKKTECLQ